MYQIEYVAAAEEELGKIGAYWGRQIVTAVEKQLTTEPTAETRNRKKLVGLTPPFEAVEPIWELRVGEYRVFYDVDEEARKVVVRAVRKKPPHKTTEEIL